MAQTEPVVDDDDPSKLSHASASAETERILAAVAEARGLPVTREVEVQVVDKPGIREFAKTSMYEQTTPAELLRAGRIESSLGVIPVGSDPETILLDMLEDGILGYYDPKVRTLFIGDFVSKPMLTMVVGHEIAHGLQDMHFDLQKYQKSIDHHADQESARRFLIEGEAQAAYLAWVSGDDGLVSIGEPVLQAMGDQTLEMAKFAAPYPILARALQMPYSDGTATVIRLVLRDGWTAVDALYRDLPTTTEQMLHVDKLIAREPAISVALDTDILTAALGIPPIWHDELGEAALLSMLADVASAKTARESTAGWGGDNIVAFDDADDPLPAPTVIAAVAWDTATDATEFEALMKRYLADVVGGRVVLQRRRDVVMFATRVPPGVDLKQLKRAMWTALRAGTAKTGQRRPT